MTANSPRRTVACLQRTELTSDGKPNVGETMPLSALKAFLPVAALLALATLPVSAADNGVSTTDTGGTANCVNIQMIQKKREVVECPAGDVFDFCFTREGVDLSGLLTGTEHYFNDPTYADQSVIGWDPDQIVYYGVIKWETSEGDLMTREVGVTDFKNGNYAGLGTVTGGTGRFENATGSMVSHGNGKGGGMSSGTICLN